MLVSLLFFTTLDLIWTQILLVDHTHLNFFFAGFQWNMLEDLININNFNWNPIDLKKIAKTSKN